MIKNLIITLVALVATIFGALISRAHGGGELPGKIGKFIDDLSLEAFILTLPLIPILYFAGVHLALIALAYGAGVIAVRKGHGQYMTLPYSVKIINPEDWDIIVLPIFGADPRVARRHPVLEEAVLDKTIKEYGPKKLYWRNIMGLSVSGVAITLLSSILLLTKGLLLAGIVLLLGGAAKALAYDIGWRLKKNDEATELAEYIRGALLFLAYTIVGGLLWLT